MPSSTNPVRIWDIPDGAEDVGDEAEDLTESLEDLGFTALLLYA